MAATFYELAKILGQSNIKMTERYAKLAREQIANTSSKAREIGKVMEQESWYKANVGCRCSRIVRAIKTVCSGCH